MVSVRNPSCIEQKANVVRKGPCLLRNITRFPNKGVPETYYLAFVPIIFSR